jgi:ABC-type lipoprotein release transport system permease subunit
VAGDKFCNKLKVRLKSKVVFSFQDQSGEITGSAPKVDGIFHISNNLFNEYRVFVPVSELATVTQLPMDAAHEIYVRLKSGKDLQMAKDLIQKALPGMLVQTWEEIDPSLGMISGLMDAMMMVFMSIILLALGFGIVNTMLMVVLERTRELGMLKAIGMTRRRIFNMIMLETLLLTVTGAVVGIGFSVFLVSYTGSTGIDLGNLSEGLEAAGYASFIYPSLNPMFFVELAVLVIITGISAALFPARRATRLNAAEAVRIEG